MRKAYQRLSWKCLIIKKIYLYNIQLKINGNTYYFGIIIYIYIYIYIYEDANMNYSFKIIN